MRKPSGAMLDTYLTVSAPFREALEKAMVKTLEQLAMPSRADVVSIAERMTNIEMRLDDLDAKLDNIQRLIVQAGAAPRPQPGKRTATDQARRTTQSEASEEREESRMAEAPVITDPVTAAADRLKTLTKVMTTKAAIAQTPKELVWTLNKAKLYRYIPVVPKEKRHPVPLLLVFALMNRPYILDLRPGHSFVEYMVNKGYDLYLLDWGAPGPEDKNLKFDDYTLDYMPRAIRKLKAISGVRRIQSPGLVHRSDPHHHLCRPAWRRRLAQPDSVDRSAGLFQQAET